MLLDLLSMQKKRTDTRLIRQIRFVAIVYILYNHKLVPECQLRLKTRCS